MQKSINDEVCACRLLCFDEAILDCKVISIKDVCGEVVLTSAQMPTLFVKISQAFMYLLIGALTQPVNLPQTNALVFVDNFGCHPKFVTVNNDDMFCGNNHGYKILEVHVQF